MEFVAALHNVFLRWSQVSAVETHFKRLGDVEKDAFESLPAAALVRVALESGDVDTVREALRKKVSGPKVETVLKRMQLVQRNVHGSKSEKDILMRKFFAMRIWNGCSSLFFTLNPRDAKSPVILMLLQGDAEPHKEFPLNSADADTEAYLAEVLREHPRRLHELVAAHPLAATRCFHWTVRLLDRTLLNCVDPFCFSCRQCSAACRLWRFW